MKKREREEKKTYARLDELEIQSFNPKSNLFNPNLPTLFPPNEVFEAKS